MFKRSLKIVHTSEVIHIRLPFILRGRRGGDLITVLLIIINTMVTRNISICFKFCLNFRPKTRFVKHQISNVIEDDEI